MRHLFDLPELFFLMGFLAAGQPMGIGILYCVGSTAVLCGRGPYPSIGVKDAIQGSFKRGFVSPLREDAIACLGGLPPEGKVTRI